MVSWFRKHPPPPPRHPANPGDGASIQTAFSNGERTWSESEDLIESLTRTLRALGYRVKKHRDWLGLDELQLVPRFMHLQPLERGGVSIASTIQVSHPALIPEGVFEYQHATGATVREAFANGFKGWAETDLPVFLDAQRAQPETTTFLGLKPGREGSSLLARNRRVIFGPPLRMGTPSANATAEEHPFCPCCLFTNCHEAFRDFLLDSKLCCIRLFAMRSADGSAEADCRVNGEDWPAGIDALAAYAKTWPFTGTEYRKQYVCIQSLDENADDGQSA
jgi:hypothetical protein